jgi:hypothetical protein
MTRWLRRARSVLGMGLLWAAGGAVIGGVFELLDNVLPGRFPWIARVDMWPQTLMIPGFIGGVLFAVVLLVAARRTRFDELSLPRFAAWGATAGVVLGGIAVSIGAPVAFVALTAAFGALASGGLLLVARRGASPTAIARGAEPAALLSVGPDDESDR